MRPEGGKDRDDAGWLVTGRRGLRGRHGRRAAGAIAFLSLAMAWSGIPATGAFGQEAGTPHWIWHPGGDVSGSFPAGSRYFRKSFRVKEDSRLALEVTADNAFSLYLDGKLMAEGRDWATAQRVDARLAAGPHVLAVKASNEAPGPAGLLVRGGVLPLGQGVPVHSDATWRSSEMVPPGDGWTGPSFDDRDWARAQDLGPLGTGPWGMPTVLKDAAERFRVPPGFTCETVGGPQVTGSAVTFTFDPEGRPCVSIEGGPIARLFDDDRDGRYDRREPIAPDMNNCQGLSFIKDQLYAVGNGPQGAGVYRLSDPSRDGVFEKTELIRLSKGGMGEHGPHAIAPGPDGRLYYDNGNHAHLRPPIDPASPVSVAYEGELLPHYNDSRGHAAGIMAPGGEIYRSDDEGRSWKRVVAGFRNQYDFAFNRDDELFTFDSDMEWDVGLPWYRPVRVNHCPVGAEFGWRNGSGKWPTYYVDSLPAVLDVGRGSPTGVTFYQAGQFPEDYHDRMLICDWSQGRILAVKLAREGASYRASADELVTGQPLNCTDIEVGPDGAVYFTTGGRGTQGGLFRVAWARGPAARRASDFPDPVEEAIGIDSPLASFSRRRIEDLHRQHSRGLEEGLRDAALGTSRTRPPRQRARALDLLFQFGRADEALLITLAKDADPSVRARAVSLLGLLSSPPVIDQLTSSLSDRDPFVRRHACEGLMQQPEARIPVAPLLAVLSDPDRFLRHSARVALEHADLAAHRAEILALSDPRARVEGMLALVRRGPLSEADQEDLLERQIAILEQKTAADVEIDLLRLIELTYLLGPRKADAAPSAALRACLLERFSTTEDSPANREAARLLAFLQEPKAVAAILAHQAAVSDRPAQIHDAYCLRALKQGWTAGTKRQLWDWYETASRWEGGFSFLGYLDYMIQELVGLLSPEERAEFFATGEKSPFPTRILVRELRLGNDPDATVRLVSLYRRLASSTAAGPQADDLRGVILEKLGRRRGPDAHAALRELHEVDAARRDQIARALADHPEERDLPIFVAALASRDPNTSNLATSALLRLEGSPGTPEGLVNLLRLARRTGPASRPILDQLASRWTKAASPAAGLGFDESLAAWERVYRERYPNGPAIGAAEAAGSHAYDLPMLIDNVIRGPAARTASPERGSQVIVRARCLDCHKFGDKGAGLGPDLTTVNSRFRPVEILESMVLPSKVVSDQYRSISLATQDGKVYGGMPIVSDGPNLVLLLSDGTKVTIPKDEIEEQKAVTTSVMPEGLLNTLSYQEIADLLALFNSMPRVAAPQAAGGQAR